MVDNPGGKIRVQAGDSLFLIGTEAQVQSMEELSHAEPALA